MTASDTARLTAISIRSVNTIFLKLRKRIALECEKQTPFKGVIEIDESYFGPRRIRGKRGRGAGSKTIVFGIFKRNYKIYTEIVPDASKASLISVIRGNQPKALFILTDGVAITAWWTLVIQNTFVYDTGTTNLPTVTATSMASNLSGLMPKDDW